MRYGTWLGNGKSGGSYTGGPYRLVVHTTETSGLPGYNNGFSAPHITYDPEFGNFYQHTEFATAARALANPSGGVQTNRRSALQIEIIAYANKAIADQTESRVWVGDLTDQNYFDLREFIDFCSEEYGVQKYWPGKQAFSYSQANAPGFRMTGAEWDVFDGVCGHQHVPEQTHWDPGAIDWDRLIVDMTPEQLQEGLTEFFTVTFKDRSDGSIRRMSDLISDSIWAAEVGRGEAREFLSSVLVQARDFSRADFLNGDLEVDELTEAVVDAIEAAGIAEAVADELASRLVD